MFRQIASILSAIVIGATSAMATSPFDIKFHNEASDTTAITNILIECATANLDDHGEYMTAIAANFIGRPYAAHTLEGNTEQLTVNLDEFDCTTLVETVAALAITVYENRTSWRDFVYNLRKIRYRGGEINGYPSRLHYISDWIVDNTHRGNIKDVTDRIGKASYQVKTIDFMSQNRDKYAALKDDDTYSRIKSHEIGYRSHRYPYIKPANIKSTKIKDGDIIFITSAIKGLDVSHAGIAKLVDGVPHLVHASSKENKVIIDPLPLHEYVLHNRKATGIRIVRIRD